MDRGEGFVRTVSGVRAYAKIVDKGDREFLDYLVTVFGYLISYSEMGVLISFEEVQVRIAASFSVNNIKIKHVLDFLDRIKGDIV